MRGKISVTGGEEPRRRFLAGVDGWPRLGTHLEPEAEDRERCFLIRFLLGEREPGGAMVAIWARGTNGLIPIKSRLCKEVNNALASDTVQLEVR